jgi:hypothetical protein
MFTHDPRTALALARLHQEDIKASFPRKARRFRPDRSVQPPRALPPVRRADVGAPTIPMPRQPDRETVVA